MQQVFFNSQSNHSNRVGQDEAHVAQEMYFDIPVPSGVLPIVFLIFPDSSNLLPSPWRSSRVHWVLIEGGLLCIEPRFLMEAPCRRSREPSGFMTTESNCRFIEADNEDNTKSKELLAFIIAM